MCARKNVMQMYRCARKKPHSHAQKNRKLTRKKKRNRAELKNNIGAA